MEERTCLSFEELCGLVLSRLKVNAAVPFQEATGLWDELALDSFDALGLIIIVEQMADVAYTPFDLPALFTLGDVYEYYLRLLAQAREGM